MSDEPVGECKPLLCRLGWHRHIYRDVAMFTSADRCGECHEWVNAADGARVDRERQKWADGTVTFEWQPDE